MQVSLILIFLCLSFVSIASYAVSLLENASSDSQWNQQDDAALLTLINKIKLINKTENEFTIKKTINNFLPNLSLTEFSNQAPEIIDSDYLPTGYSKLFPTKKPEGVTDDEWQALQISHVDFSAENGNVSYSLIDLNSDGLRDLIVNAYVGGTGLFNEVYLLKRQGSAFLSNPFEETDGYFYSINGRGANQSASWISINHHIYLLYTESVFGEDKILLKKPFADNLEVPVINISYSYTFSIDKVQKPVGRTEYQLDDETYTAIIKALTPLNKLTTSREAEDASIPLCPNLKEDQGYNLGPGHYTIEIVANFPIWINKQCYFGRVINWFGSYAENGLIAQLTYANPDTPDNIHEVQIVAKRKTNNISQESIK